VQKRSEEGDVEKSNMEALIAKPRLAWIESELSYATSFEGTIIHRFSIHTPQLGKIIAHAAGDI
jgi:hypothetical protein